MKMAEDTLQCINTYIS